MYKVGDCVVIVKSLDDNSKQHIRKVAVVNEVGVQEEINGRCEEGVYTNLEEADNFFLAYKEIELVSNRKQTVTKQQ